MSNWNQFCLVGKKSNLVQSGHKWVGKKFTRIQLNPIVSNWFCANNQSWKKFQLENWIGNVGKGGCYGSVCYIVLEWLFRVWLFWVGRFSVWFVYPSWVWCLILALILHVVVCIQNPLIVQNKLSLLCHDSCRYFPHLCNFDFDICRLVNSPIRIIGQIEIDFRFWNTLLQSCVTLLTSLHSEW